jgi:hypothetical protein
MNQPLTIGLLQSEAAKFASIESAHSEPLLYGVTDGKAVGTYLEQKFTDYLQATYTLVRGNSASGIDLPDLDVDIKVTSIRQPQSSCPFKSASQKIFGLGYHLLVFVYEKSDDHISRTCHLDIQHTVFIHKDRTADYQTTRGLINILNNDGNRDDVIAFIIERNLPIDEIGAEQLANRIIESTPLQGYLTISNALQWRLQYGRAINETGSVPGLVKVR